MDATEFYDFMPGKISTKNTNSRVFLLAARSWALLEADMLSTFSTGAQILIHRMGETYGSGIAKGAQFQADSKEGRLHKISDLAVASGWGTPIVSGDFADATRVRVEMNDCIFCADSPKQGSPSCFFLAGLLTGIISAVYGPGFYAEEKECIRAGKGSCVFVVKKR